MPATSDQSIPTLEYGFARVGELEVDLGPGDRKGVRAIDRIKLRGQQLRPTRRFLNSIGHRFQFTENVFRYFSHREVFQRIAERAPDATFRYCIHRRDSGDGVLLAASNPQRPVITPAELQDLAKRYAAIDLKYADGVITTEHVPHTGEYPVRIGGDDFCHRFVLDTPVDGYGTPRIHLAMLRTVCSNGMIGYARAFRSEISVGKDVAYAIARAMNSFDNSDGYAALRQRFDSAQRSWASIREAEELYRVLARLHVRRGRRSDSILADYYQVTGRLQELYGLANLDALGSKRQRVLPAKCRVYDLLNFASEVGTHHATPAGNRLLQAYIGNLISDEYDLEGSGDRVSDFNDFFVSQN